MKTITICQPYAALILLGQKFVENRTWKPPESMLGRPLAIHAGKSRSWLDTYEPLPERMDFGAIVGVCTLAACFPSRAIETRKIPVQYAYLTGHEHVSGPMCWVLTDVRRLVKPIDFRGQQGIFDVPDELLKDFVP